MVSCSLRWSRIEFGFVSCCHCVAVLSVLQTHVATWLSSVLLAGVCASLCRYLWCRIQTFFRFEKGSFHASKPMLFIAQEFARIGYLGRVVETEPPRLTYLSEFLIVLEMRVLSERSGEEPVRLALWPDSLNRSDSCRLRRYLRFELRSSLRDI